MSTKPAVLPEWDLNQTHVTPTVAAHKNSGYGTDEIPASDEVNYWKNLVYQWTKYADEHVALNAQTIELSSADWKSIRGNNTLDAEGLWECDPTGFELVAGLVLPVGARIDECVFSTRRDSAQPPNFAERLVRRAAGAANSELVISTFPPLSTVAWVSHDIVNSGGGGVGAGPGPHVIATGFRYWLSISLAFDPSATGTRRFDGVKLVVSWP